jgi:hypothetical protein
MGLLLSPLAALGYCQPDGTFVVTPQDLRERLGEMARSGEAGCVDGFRYWMRRLAESQGTG